MTTPASAHSAATSSMRRIVLRGRARCSRYSMTTHASHKWRVPSGDGVRTSASRPQRSHVMGATSPEVAGILLAPVYGGYAPSAARRSIVSAHTAVATSSIDLFVTSITGQTGGVW